MTAIEWLAKEIFRKYKFTLQQLNCQPLEGAIEQAKEMEKQQKDDFAIGFAEWLRENYYDNGELWTEWNSDDNTHSSKQLLEIYKKEIIL